MNVLLVLDEAPYGSENPYNALRLAMALQREHQARIRIFLLGHAVACALRQQTTPNGYYNLERMLRAIIARGGEVKACGSCAEARGLARLHLAEGAALSNMSQLAQWVVDSDRVLTF